MFIELFGRMWHRQKQQIKTKSNKSIDKQHQNNKQSTATYKETGESITIDWLLLLLLLLPQSHVMNDYLKHIMNINSRRKKEILKME